MKQTAENDSKNSALLAEASSAVSHRLHGLGAAGGGGGGGGGNPPTAPEVEPGKCRCPLLSALNQHVPAPNVKNLHPSFVHVALLH
jgi:hypothetical protein